MAVITMAKIAVDNCGHQDTVHTENLSVNICISYLIQVTDVKKRRREV